MEDVIVVKASSKGIRGEEPADESPIGGVGLNDRGWLNAACERTMRASCIACQSILVKRGEE
jgi:hypothetical protein